MIYNVANGSAPVLQFTDDYGRVSQFTQADVDRLHAPGFWDVAGIILQWAVLTVGSVVLGAVAGYALIKAFLWLRDLYRTVATYRENSK